MAQVHRLLLLLVLVLGTLQSIGARAECGGSTQCISIGRTPAEADTNHHGGGSGTLTLDFGNTAVGATSSSQVVYVAAVTGPAGTMANLGNITMSGGDAVHFVITGGSCSDVQGPVHGGAQCTIAIAFNPLSVGPKSATVDVPLDPPICAGCVTGRTFTIIGTGVEGAPVITSPLTAAGTVGVPFAGYQITASGNPTRFGATGLPPGLTLSASGVISGTPTQAGTFNATITATNANGTDSRTLVFTINPPTVTAPTVTSVSVTVPYETTTQIPLAGAVSGNYTSLALASQPSHGIATLSGTVVTYTPALGYSGPDSFTFTATGPGGTSAPGTVQITVGTLAPTARDATITVPINGAATLDLRPFITGSGITRVTIATQPARGAVAVAATAVTYTPSPNAFGSDSFTYIAIGNAGSSPPARVTVTIVGRPDPTRDRAVTGILEAQSSAAQRFSAAQIANVQRRMEALHRAAPAGGARVALAPAFASLATTGSVDLSTLGSGGGASRERLNFWVGGVAQFGRREADGSLGAFDFTTRGLSAGVDRRFGDRVVLGVGLGAARDRTEVGADGSGTRARGASGVIYGSFQPTASTFIDVLAGGGKLDLEARRFVEPIATTLETDRDGRQVFASVAVGYEHRRNGVVFAPYGRLDYSRDTLDAVTETGGAPYALAYSGQSASWMRGALGLRAEATIATRFGWATPRLRAEYRRHFRGSRTTDIAYADLLDGPRYSFSSDASERSAMALGLGADFVFRNGLTLGLEYGYQRASGGDHDQLIRVNLSQELAGTGSLRWLEGLYLEPTRPLDLQLDAGFTYHDNVTRALSEADQRLDRSFGVNARISRARMMGSHMRGVLGVSLGAEKFQYHDGLSHATAGLRGEIQYRPSGAFAAPTFAAFLQAATEQYESRLRDGEVYLVGGSVRVPITDRLGLFGTVFHQRREARSEVFDGRQDGARLNLDLAVGAHGAFYVSGEYRRGDHVTSANPVHASAAFKDTGDWQVADDAFRGPDLVTARFKGKSWLGTVGYNFALGPRDAIDFSWRRIRSKPDDAADVVIGFYVPEPPVRYTVNQFMILYLLSF